MTWDTYRRLKGLLNPYMSWSAVCSTKIFDKMRCWQTLWLRLCRAVNLKARVSEPSIDRGEMSKIDSFSGHNLLWYSVNLLLCRCYSVAFLKVFNTKRCRLTCTVRGGRDQSFCFCSSLPAFREVIGALPLIIDQVVGWLMKPLVHSHDSTTHCEVLTSVTS